MLKRLPVVFSIVISLVAFASLGSAQSPKHGLPTLTPQNSGTAELLIAVSPVSPNVVWASGTSGTFVVTTDGGNTWTSGVVPGAEALQFRDVQGVSDKKAYLMSIGDNTSDFRIYKTEDGGANWALQFTNALDGAFYDCMAFWTGGRGIAHSDSVSGVFPDLRTTNGTTWDSISANMPPALDGEFSFSSSGTCIATQGTSNAWITTGGAAFARILATTDGGDSWSAYNTPLEVSPSGGGFSVAFRDSLHGIVGGGDLAGNGNIDAAISQDGGKTWVRTAKPPVFGTIFGLAYARGNNGGADPLFDRAVVVTSEYAPDFNSGAAAWSPNEGKDWFKLNGVSGYWAVGFANPHAGWFVGNNGAILKISF